MKLSAALVPALFAMALPAVAQTAVPQPSTKIRGVIELFTSQGCSSCPPADKLMAELAKDSGLLVLSLPVDYWDYLGWKDTFAQPSFTYRQRVYAGMRGDRQVYTPQAVINGAAHAIGSDKGQIEKAIAVTTRQAGVLSTEIGISKSEKGLSVSCPDRQADAVQAHLWVMPYFNERVVQIGRGENTGRSVTYVNVARSLTRIGSCTGAAASVDIPASSIVPDADGVVVLLQAGTDKKPTQVLGAARRIGL